MKNTKKRFRLIYANEYSRVKLISTQTMDIQYHNRHIVLIHFVETGKSKPKKSSRNVVISLNIVQEIL